MRFKNYVVQSKVKRKNDFYVEKKKKSQKNDFYVEHKFHDE